jgi:hypothetical protein
MAMKRLVSPFQKLTSFRLNFTGRNPREEFEKAMEKLKSKIKEGRSNMNMNDDDNKKYQKYFIGLAIYLSVAAGLYELKKERAILITHE